MKWFGNRFKKNVLVLGSDGMLGHDVYEHFKGLQLLGCIESVTGLDVKDGVNVHEDPLTCSSSLKSYFAKSPCFDFCINCIAYTNTAAAENDAEGQRMSYRLNALAPKYIARACAESGTKLVHVSTDYVFSQHSMHREMIGGSTFGTYDEPFPCNMYGLHKLLGEEFIRDEMHGNDYAILRTSWLYGAHNSKSFVHKFIRNVVKLLKEGKHEVEMTSNEVSVPTSTSVVMQCIDELVRSSWTPGIVHAVPKLCNSIAPSRCDFANEILTQLKDIKLEGLDFSSVKVIPVERQTYQPSWSPMHSCTSIKLPTWKEDLTQFMQRHKAEIAAWAAEQCK